MPFFIYPDGEYNFPGFNEKGICRHPKGLKKWDNYDKLSNKQFNI